MSNLRKRDIENYKKLYQIAKEIPFEVTIKLGKKAECEESSKNVEGEKHMEHRTPMELFDELSKTVMCQNDYLMSLCTTLWLHDARIRTFDKTRYRGILPQKHNLLIIGPTGSGKTLAIQTLAKMLGYKLLIANAPDFTGTGWKGRDLETLLEDLYKQCGHDKSQTQSGIIFLDEIDKAILSQNEKEDYRTFGIEPPLLKMVEGYVASVEIDKSTVQIDTSNILFIAAGAFEGIEKIIQKRIHGKKSLGFSSGNVWSGKNDKDLLLDVNKLDLMEYGVSAQFLGRFSRLTSLRELSETDIKNILLHSQVSTVKNLDYLLHDALGIHVTIDEAGAKAIAQQAVKEKIGVRGASFMIQEVMDELLFYLPDERNVKAISIFEKDGEPAVKYVEGQPDNVNEIVIGTLHERPIKFGVEASINVDTYVDEILDAGGLILSSCNARTVRALHLLFSVSILYIIEECSESDWNTSSIKKILEAAKHETADPDEETVCDILMKQHGTHKKYARLYIDYKKIYVSNRKLDLAITACRYFEERQRNI